MRAGTRLGVLDVEKSALWRDLSSPFSPENKFAGPGDVACCLSALDFLLKIARVSAVQFFQPPRSQNALSVGERSYSMPDASKDDYSPEVLRLAMTLWIVVSLLQLGDSIQKAAEEAYTNSYYTRHAELPHDTRVLRQNSGKKSISQLPAVSLLPMLQEIS
jgi:hypothetical protein